MVSKALLFILAGYASLAAQNATLTGTLAGQIVMEGFVNIRLRPWLRRLITRLLAIVPAIVVNGCHTGERQRLTMAHEVGHLMLEPAGGLDEEKAAYRFGGAFLMPAEPLWAEVGRHRRAIAVGELLELKPLFRVSAQAIAYRCKELDIIGDGAYRSLFQTFAQLGWRSPPHEEANPLPPEQPHRFRRLCFRAAAEGLASDAKVAELLRISVRDLDREMSLLPSA